MELEILDMDYEELKKLVGKPKKANIVVLESLDHSLDDTIFMDFGTDKEGNHYIREIRFRVRK